MPFSATVFRRPDRERTHRLHRHPEYGRRYGGAGQRDPRRGTEGSDVGDAPPATDGALASDHLPSWSTLCSDEGA